MADRKRLPSTAHGPRVATYARVSSKQQAEANTIASQLAALTARVKADGLRLEPELCFADEGYSGGTLLRPALDAFVTRPRLAQSTGCMSTRRIGCHVAIPTKCCSLMSSSGTGSRSSS